MTVGEFGEIANGGWAKEEGNKKKGKLESWKKRKNGEKRGKAKGRKTRNGEEIWATEELRRFKVSAGGFFIKIAVIFYRV